MPRLNTSLAERIKERSIEMPGSGCWIWQLRIDRHGYGHTKINGQSALAHRAAYQAFVGPIAEGMTIDHLCRTPACVNPQHMEVVSNKENIRRSNGITAIAGKKTECLKGHPFSGGNLYVDLRGHRHCKACNALRTMRYKARKART